MPGAVAAAGVLAGAAALTLALGAAGAAAVTGQRLAAAADAAALAAADTASGAALGVPCERARELAGTFGARLELCEVSDMIATVAVTMSFGPLPVVASARAGPPPE
jgi:secretion/DNA translocation related TadE-like protein